MPVHSLNGPRCTGVQTGSYAQVIRIRACRLVLSSGHTWAFKDVCDHSDMQSTMTFKEPAKKYEQITGYYFRAADEANNYKFRKKIFCAVVAHMSEEGQTAMKKSRI